MNAAPLRLLRYLGRIEGVSFLVLLGIAMPLKYLAGFAPAVTVAGWIHGILFLLFCLALVRVFFACRWPPMRAAVVFAAALVPCGPFLIDGRLRDLEGGESAGNREFSPASDPAQG